MSQVKTTEKKNKINVCGHFAVYQNSEERTSQLLIS